VGANYVGKSAITCQYLYSKFNTQYSKTIEDFYQARVKLQEYTYEIDIMDTAGSDEFKSIRDQSYKNRDGFLLVYDVSQVDSFMKLESFLSSIETKKRENYHLTNKIPILLVGNKMDLETSCVSSDMVD
jgi:small GTP-binding protein